MHINSALLSCFYILAGFAAASGIAQLIYSKRWIDLPSGDRIGCIDGLRGYLAAGVAIHHSVIWLGVASGLPWQAPSPFILNNIGKAPVFLFFMVTGALFYARLLDKKFKIDWLAFAFSRLFRLTPVYWFMVAIVVAIALIRTGGDIGVPGDFTDLLLEWLAFCGMPDFVPVKDLGRIVAGVPWSLAYEWKFYLCLPLLAIIFGSPLFQVGSLRSSLPAMR